jgi:hypothetical protein
MSPESLMVYMSSPSCAPLTTGALRHSYGTGGGVCVEKAAAQNGVKQFRLSRICEDCTKACFPMD